MVKKTKDIKYYEGVGRRKESVARVRLYLTNREKTALIGQAKVKAGQVIVNGQPFEKAITTAYKRDFILTPLRLTDNLDRFAMSVIVYGGGQNGQLEAIIHGLSRALDAVDKVTFRPVLKKEGFLRRDPRKKERRKVGTGGKARRLKQSPKR